MRFADFFFTGYQPLPQQFPAYSDKPIFQTAGSHAFFDPSATQVLSSQPPKPVQMMATSATTAHFPTPSYPIVAGSSDMIQFGRTPPNLQTDFQQSLGVVQPRLFGASSPTSGYAEQVVGPSSTDRYDHTQYQNISGDSSLLGIFAPTDTHTLGVLDTSATFYPTDDGPACSPVVDEGGHAAIGPLSARHDEISPLTLDGSSHQLSLGFYLRQQGIQTVPTVAPASFADFSTTASARPSLDLVYHTNSRPMPTRRGPFKDTTAREKTARTRKMGSCIRCKMQRIRVSSHNPPTSPPMGAHESGILTVSSANLTKTSPNLDLASPAKRCRARESGACPACATSSRTFGSVSPARCRATSGQRGGKTTWWQTSPSGHPRKTR